MLTYSASELHSLRRGDVKVARPARKVIFNCHLWCPKLVRDQRLDRCDQEIPTVIGNYRPATKPLLTQRPRTRTLRTIDTVDHTESSTRCTTTCSTNCTSSLSSPALYVFNAASIAKPNAIEQLTSELIGYDIDIAVISESHLKKKHANSCVEIDGYSLFRCDRVGRKAGGVVIYARQSLGAMLWPIFKTDPNFEMLCIKIEKDGDYTFVCALYHPPSPIYVTAELLDFIENTVLRLQKDYPDSHIILAGDLNSLDDNELIIRTGMMSIVNQPTRGNNLLDRIYVSDSRYSGVKVIKSAVKSDHLAIVAYTGDVKSTIGKTRRVCKYRKHTSAQHAHFLASVSDPIHVVNTDVTGDPQAEYDRLYGAMANLLDLYYPERTVTITSADPPYITTAVKSMLRRKNQLMRSGRIEAAAAIAVKIGNAIKQYNSAELCRVDVVADAKSMWTKVRQLTGRNKATNMVGNSATITADSLNDHYAAISDDVSYTAPLVKSTVFNQSAEHHITEWRMFKILDTLPPTATGLDNIPAWFLQIGAPFFSAPITGMMNLSLSSSTVPRQWKAASILSIQKIPSPLFPSDYRPISITPVLSRLLERIVVTDYIYPSFQSPPPNLTFMDQFAFKPAASTTVALIHLLHTITTLLVTNQYVIVYALDFSKAFDTVRHRAVLDKFVQLQMPDNIYNWIESFFRDHSHCTKFGNEISGFRKIFASIIQGSGIGPASYVVTASDLHAETPGNCMVKFADDTYLIIPESNLNSRASEIAHVEQWAMRNNLRLNRTKSVEIVFVPPRSGRAIVLPPPDVPGFVRVEAIKALGVTISRRFSVVQHVDALLAGCAQTLFALRTLRQHGMPTIALRAVFQAIVMGKLLYAAPAWWGYASAADRGRLEAFLRRSVSFGYRDASAPSLAHICSQADDKLFGNIIRNEKHLLRPLLPPERNRHYSLRHRRHNLQLPVRTSALNNNNFLIRMLFKDLSYSSQSSSTI